MFQRYPSKNKCQSQSRHNPTSGCRGRLPVSMNHQGLLPLKLLCTMLPWSVRRNLYFSQGISILLLQRITENSGRGQTSWEKQSTAKATKLSASACSWKTLQSGERITAEGTSLSASAYSWSEVSRHIQTLSEPPTCQLLPAPGPGGRLPNPPARPPGVQLDSGPCRLPRWLLLCAPGLAVPQPRPPRHLIQPPNVLVETILPDLRS